MIQTGSAFFVSLHKQVVWFTYAVWHAAAISSFPGCPLTHASHTVLSVCVCVWFTLMQKSEQYLHGINVELRAVVAALHFAFAVLLFGVVHFTAGIPDVTLC